MVTSPDCRHVPTAPSRGCLRLREHLVSARLATSPPPRPSREAQGRHRLFV
jgi:hypothetical protein